LVIAVSDGAVVDLDLHAASLAKGRAITTKQIIRGLDRPPIIIGHSFGGLFTQLLLDCGLGAAGVAIGTGCSSAGRTRSARLP
jgi:predicted alpha/beta hydrolase